MMIAQFIKDKFGKDLIENDCDILSIIKNPVCVDKSKCPLWKFVTVKEDVERKRSNTNYKDVVAFELDYDGTISINEFKEKYSEYCYYLYTTSSHKINDIDKFRVIVPLKECFEFSRYSDKIFLNCLLDYFDGIDSSCFRNFHNCPNKPLNNPENYEWYFNEGNFFDISIFEEKYEFLKKQDEREKNFKKTVRKLKQTKNKKVSESAKLKYKEKVLESVQKMLDEIPTHKTGNRYNTLLMITGKLINYRYSDESYIFEDDDVFKIITSHTDDSRVRHMINDFLKKRI